MRQLSAVITAKNPRGPHGFIVGWKKLSYRVIQLANSIKFSTKLTLLQQDEHPHFWEGFSFHLHTSSGKLLTHTTHTAEACPSSSRRRLMEVGKIASIHDGGLTSKSCLGGDLKVRIKIWSLFTIKYPFDVFAFNYKVVLLTTTTTEKEFSVFNYYLCFSLGKIPRVHVHSTIVQ